jgi:hypothetical protein
MKLHERTRKRARDFNFVIWDKQLAGQAACPPKLEERRRKRVILVKTSGEIPPNKKPGLSTGLFD